MSDYFSRRPLKDLGSKAIEEAIKKTICELTGEEYESDIITINFEPSKVSNPHLNDCVELNIRLQKKIDFSFLRKQENA